MNNNFALIIGAMKCGTTSLFYYLSEHPQVSAAEDKEPHFFSDDCTFTKGITWYQSLWEWKPEHRIALEASTTYAMQPKYPNAAQRIAQLENAQFRFIYIMRHPFARIESHVRHLLAEGLLTRAEITEEQIAFSKYASQLDVYAKLFGREQIHLLLLEDLQKDPKTELRRVCQFLQIEPNYNFENVDVVRNSKETLNLNPILRQLYKNSALKSLGKLISPRIRQKLYKPLSRTDPHEVKLSEQDKATVLKRLQPDLARLEADYGVDVQGKWGLPIMDKL